MVFVNATWSKSLAAPVKVNIIAITLIEIHAINEVSYIAGSQSKLHLLKYLNTGIIIFVVWLAMSHYSNQW